MKSGKTPTWKKQTPTNNPELLEKWKLLYRELMTTGQYNQTQALEELGIVLGGISRSTLRYHLFPTDREKQKKSRGHQWSYQRQNPKTRERIVSYKSRYMRARRHISELVRECYQQTDNHEAFTIEELSDIIDKKTGISLNPSTLTGLIKQHEAKKGPLLVEVFGYSVPRYRLSK